MFNLMYVQLFNWAIDPVAKVLCSIGFLFNSFWAIRDVQWDMFGSPATEQSSPLQMMKSWRFEPWPKN